MAKKSGRTSFDNVLMMVRDDPEKVFAKYARMLSDLSPERLDMLRKTLAEFTPERRAAFYRCMEDAAMESYEYNFAPIAEIGLEDPDGDIRAAAIHVLGFEDSREIGGKILNAAENDPDEKAQIAAIEILGQYMFESAIENRIPVNRRNLHETLKKLIESERQAVRRSAVVSYAISEDKRVKEIISGFLAGNDREELVAALAAVRHAMGEEWADTVLELMRHDDDDVSLEAIRTAGALQLREALPALYEIISRFDRVTPDLLMAAVNAVAEIGDEGSLDVLETLGEAAVDMDEEITEAIDDAIDTLNMAIYINPSFDHNEWEQKTPKHVRDSLRSATEAAKDHCLSILEEKIPHDLEDDEPILQDESEDDECGCGDHHHHHHHEHRHDNPLEGLDLSRFRILDDLESYEKSAAHDADEEDLWAEFEDMAEEDLDADSLQDFINKLEQRRKK